MPVCTHKCLFGIVAILVIGGCGTSQSNSTSPTTSPSEATVVPRPDGVIGYYVHDDPAFYKVKDMKDVAAGRIMYLGIEDGRWKMQNAHTGYGGTWVESPDGAILAIKQGPAEMVKSGQKSIARRTESGINLAKAGTDGPYMMFTYIASAAPSNFGYGEVHNGK